MHITNNNCNKTLLTILTLLKILPLLYLEFILKTVTIVTKLSGTFLLILTLTIQEMLPLCLHFSKQQCLSLSTFLFGSTLTSWGQLLAVRMFNIHLTFVHLSMDFSGKLSYISVRFWWRSFSSKNKVCDLFLEFGSILYSCS